jgi:hypothetical protein
LQTATDRGWHLAAERLQRDLLETLRRLQEELTCTLHQFERNQHSTNSVSIRDLYADLLGLTLEFEDVKFAARDETLSVTTEPIELESVYLGSFEICLEVGDWSKDASPDYRVIAKEPQSATANEDVTHPHVQHEILCEGEGRNPLRQAWEQGRLYDFFLIVANLLRTYNPASPYVTLEDWFGVECSDCRGNVPYDDQRSCDHCESLVCEECFDRCLECSDGLCSECATCCPACNEKYCEACMSSCDSCHTPLCPECLDNKERCSSCHEQETTNAEKDQSQEEKASAVSAADVAVQPHGVGEAVGPTCLR